MSGRTLILAARRTAVAPRGGLFRGLQADELAAPVISALLQDAGLAADQVDHVIFGNALYGGGNPARMAALRAGLPDHVPAMTIDSQCCSGLDAILMGWSLIEAGMAHCVIAGGLESFSRAPIRQHRPLKKGDAPRPYDRPAFAPDPALDPDLAEAAAALAARHRVFRRAQAEFACQSHRKARQAQAAGRLAAELVHVPREDPADGGALPCDPFTRPLRLSAALRAPLIAGTGETGVSTSTTAVEADGAAALLLVSETAARALRGSSCQAGAQVSLRAGMSTGGAPADPAVAPVAAIRSLLARARLPVSALTRIELMEAFAVQAMVTAAALELPPEALNREGGALARGHPIGASGAVLAVRLFHGLIADARPGLGLCAIPAAGGLASVALIECCP